MDGASPYHGHRCIRATLENTAPYSMFNIIAVCPYADGKQTDLMHVGDIAPGETGEWEWSYVPPDYERVRLPVQSRLACRLMVHHALGTQYHVKQGNNWTLWTLIC